VLVGVVLADQVLNVGVPDELGVSFLHPGYVLIGKHAVTSIIYLRPCPPAYEVMLVRSNSQRNFIKFDAHMMLQGNGSKLWGSISFMTLTN
jgi:hypothetical protein